MKIALLCLCSITFGTLHATPAARITPLLARLGIFGACSYYLYDQHYHSGKKMRTAINSAQETIISSLQEHCNTLQVQVISNQKEMLWQLKQQQVDLMRELKTIHVHNKILLDQNRKLQKEIRTLNPHQERTNDTHHKNASLPAQSYDDKKETRLDPAHLFFFMN